MYTGLPLRLLVFAAGVDGVDGLLLLELLDPPLEPPLEPPLDPPLELLLPFPGPALPPYVAVPMCGLFDGFGGLGGFGLLNAINSTPHVVFCL